MKTYVEEFGINGFAFIGIMDSLRRTHKNEWFAWVGNVEGKEVRVKNHGLWIQIFDIDGIRCGGRDHKRVGEWVNTLIKPFKGQ